MNWHNLNCLDISDIHMGHPNTRSEWIIPRLTKYITEHVKNDSIKYIFLSGDQFDRLLNLPSVDASEISLFITWLLRFCQKHKVKLRILEGTPSHDWKQNYLFTQRKTELSLDVDVRYFDKLCIDYEEEYGLNILYVPDEWSETDDTLRQVKELLNSKGLEKVDLAIMHGMFAFQLPEHLRSSLPVHDQVEYEKIVDKLIIIGHDHCHKTSGKVVVPGSFDRLVHGEENPKGFIHFVLKREGRPKVTFIENKDATIYKSIVLESNDIAENLKLIDDVIMTLPNWSRVRLVYQRGNPISLHLKELKSKYPTIYWSAPKVIKVDEQGLTIKEVVKKEYTAIILNKDNLVEKVIAEALSREPDSDEEILKNLLREAMRYVRSTE